MSYPGGKNGAGVFQALINVMPPHDVYIEPFLGAGALLRLKRPARLNIGIDLDPAALEAARRSASQDWARAAAIAGTGGVTRSEASIGVDVDVRRRRPLESAMTAAIGGDGGSRSPIAIAGEAGGVAFIQGDGIQFLESYEWKGGELVYCDPPYLLSTRKCRRRYRFEMTDADHRRLLRCCRDLPCMVMISGYSSTLYAKELRGWNATAFQAATRGAPAAEWVWYNFDRPLELHDYRFLGNDFRERERIKRKVRRWTTRLSGMPILERQAMLAAIATIAGSGAASSSVL